MDAAAIRQVHRDLGYPGLQATVIGVKREAARRGVEAPKRAEIAEIVRTAGERQVFQPQQKSGQATVYALGRDQYLSLIHI